MALGKGWWQDGRPIPECLMLIVTELAEACEADRNGDKDNFKEEIADVYIRLGDLCGWLDIDIEKEIKKKMTINKNRPYKHGKKYQRDIMKEIREIGKTAKELDSKEIIYRIRIGPRTIKRIFLAVLVWLIIIMLMYKFL